MAGMLVSGVGSPPQARSGLPETHAQDSERALPDSAPAGHPSAGEQLAGLGDRLAVAREVGVDQRQLHLAVGHAAGSSAASGRSSTTTSNGGSPSATAALPSSR